MLPAVNENRTLGIFLILEYYLCKHEISSISLNISEKKYLERYTLQNKEMYYPPIDMDYFMLFQSTFCSLNLEKNR